METKKKKYQVTIIGAGITGLLLTLKLSKLGKSVLLLEANNVIAEGPSTRNEGWIHAGSYHAFGIDNEKTAIKVAKNCIYGYNQIKTQFPECIEEPFTESVVLIKEAKNIKRAEKRWSSAGVSYKKLNNESLKHLLHDVNIPKGSAGFLVKEKAINTRILYERILHEIEIISANRPESVCIRTGVRDIRFSTDKNSAMLEMNDDVTSVIKSDFYIYCSGAGTKDIFAKEHPSIDCPIRIFQSHLLITERMSENNVFFVEEGEITAMGHGNMTIIGSTKDNDDIKLTVDLNDAHLKRKKHLIERTHKLFKKELKNHKVYSCYKVDVGEKEGFQSLEPKIYEDQKLKNHIICCPGKMTEAPILVDKLIQVLYKRLNSNSKIALRPLDAYKRD